MFGPNIPTLSFGRVLGGLSKTLGVVNQVIPIYKEAKPMLQNAKNAISLIKEFSNTTTNRVMQTKEKNLSQIKEKINDISLNNYKIQEKGPTFFQ